MPEPKKLLKKLDEIAVRIEQDEDNAKVLRNKIKFISQQPKDYSAVERRNLSDGAQEKEDQLFAFFVEVALYDVLAERGYENIKYLQEGKRKQPEIKAEKSGEDFFFEAKRIRRPSVESAILRTQGMYSSYPRNDFREGIKKKMEDFAKDAAEKFDMVGAKKENRTMIVDYEVGIDAIVNVEGDDKRNLRKILGDRYFDDLERRYRMKVEVLNFDF